MSDILIKGMKMPERCDNCPFHVRNHGEGFYSCVITGHFPIPIGDTERSCECVLKELPPHGRLIDADAFIKNECSICDGYCECTDCDYMNCKHEYRCEMIQDIMNMETIIEAEEET